MSKNKDKENLFYAAVCIVTAAILTFFTVFDENHDDYMGKLARQYDLTEASETAADSAENSFINV